MCETRRLEKVLEHSSPQTRPQGFSLKEWVGREVSRPTHLLREKPWGRGCLLPTISLNFVVV